MLKLISKSHFFQIFWAFYPICLWAGFYSVPLDSWTAQKPTPISVAKYRVSQYKPAMAVACSSDNSQALSAAKSTIYLLNLTTGNKAQVFKGSGTYTHLAFLPNKQAFLTSGPTILEMRSLTDGAKLDSLPEFDDKFLSSVTVAPDTTLLAIGYRETGDIALWDMQAGRMLPPLVGHDFGVLAMAFTTNGERLVSVGYDGTMRLWDVSTGAELKRFEVYSTQDSVVAIDTDTNTLLTSGGRNPVVCRWDLKNGEQLSCLNDGDTLWVTSLAIAPGGHHALSGGPKGDVILWDLDTGRPISQYDAGSLIHDVAICPNGDYGLSASEDGAIHVWNLQKE